MKIIELTELCRPKQWKTISGKNLLDSGYPVYGANGKIGYWSEYNHEKETLTIACRGTCGAVNLIEPKAYINGNAMCLDDLSEQIRIRYLYYYLKWYDMAKVITGTSIPQITIESLKKINVPVPTLQKQDELIEKLDKITSIIDNRKYEIKKLDKLIKARFIEIFGDPQKNPFNWNIVNISETITSKASNGFFAKRNDYCDDGNVKVLGVANIVNRMYSAVDNLPRTNADENDIKKYAVKYGDMLFCRSSLVAEGIGKASIVPEINEKNILFECHVIRLQLDLAKCVPEFIQTLSTMDYFRSQIISQSKTATMTTIGQDGILKTKIILPPLEKQKEFYRFVKQIEKTKLSLQKSLEKTQLLFDSLMQEYFG